MKLSKIKLDLEIPNETIIPVYEEKYNSENFNFNNGQKFAKNKKKKQIIIKKMHFTKKSNNGSFADENSASSTLYFSQVRELLEPTYKKDISANIYVTNDKTMCKTLFYPCNTTLVKYNDDYIVNVRYVNYLIYHNNEDNSCAYEGLYDNVSNVYITLNKYLKLNPNFEEIESKMLDINFDEVENKIQNRNYFLEDTTHEIVVGIEDVRLYNLNNVIKYIGSERVNLFNTLVVHGDYNFTNLNNANILYNNGLSFHIKEKVLKTCEKNWTLFDLNNELLIIYKWHPLQICSISGNNIFLKKEVNTPECFKKFRGSTSGSKYNNNIWFLIHVVDHSINKYNKYFHAFVILDDEGNLLKYSQLFVFEKYKIEFCTGLLVEEKNIIMTYSLNDNCSKLAVYDRVNIINSLKWISL